MSSPTCSICHHLSHDGVRCSYVQPADKGLIGPRCDCRGPQNRKKVILEWRVDPHNSDHVECSVQTTYEHAEALANELNGRNYVAEVRTMNKQIPPECPACPHPAHLGRCQYVDTNPRHMSAAALQAGAVGEQCDCPGPSDTKREHAISFAYGNVNLSNPAVTREMVEREYDKLHPSDSAERPAFAMNNDPEWLRKKAEAEDGCNVSVGDPGPATVKCSWCGGTLLRILSPDEPPCPMTPQELRADAETVNWSNHWIARRLRALADWLAHMERKGA